MNVRLPQITNETEFAELFKSDKLWEGAVGAIGVKHGLQGRSSRASRGSNIVYRVGESWIKIFPPFESEEMAFERAGLETASGVKGTFDVPQIQFDGDLEGWPYLVLSHVSGERIGDVWQEASSVQKVFLAEQIADVTQSLQSLPPLGKTVARISWNQFVAE